MRARQVQQESPESEVDVSVVFFVKVSQELSVVLVLLPALIVTFHLLWLGVEKTITKDIRLVKDSSFILEPVPVMVLLDIFMVECCIFYAITLYFWLGLHQGNGLKSHIEFFFLPF